jgi:hypothetical protein
MPDNYGIQQSGGTSNVGNQAVGPKARAISHNLHFTAGLNDLMTLLERHRDELPPTTIATAERLQEELAKPQPDRRVLTRVMDQLTTLVKPVTPLVNTVAELAKAINSAFHG